MTTLWFGNTSKFATVPAPDLPFSGDRSGYATSFRAENGGAYEQVSQGHAKRYNFTFNLQSADDLKVYERFRQGSYGRGLLNFVNPFAFESNLLPPAWAEPGLIEGDWPSNYDYVPTFSSVSANSYDQPLRKATYTITQAANTAPTNQSSTLIVPIPPTHTLHLGASGAKTGTAVVHVVAHNIAAGTTSSSDLTLLSDTSSTRLNASFSGASYDYVAIDFRRTTSAASTLTLTSMLAQLWLTGLTPTLTGNHQIGDGHTGLMFSGDTYSQQYRLDSTGGERFTGVSFSMTEVGAWLK